MKYLLLVALVLSSIGSALALNVSISATAEGTHPLVTGATNLPDGIELMITVERSKNDYFAQAKSTVQQGKFSAGPFSRHGQPLDPGTYSLRVVMPIPAVQPQATWATIGKNGEKLSGPITKQSKYGGKIAEYKTSFRVGAGVPSPSRDKAARASAESERKNWIIQSCRESCVISQVAAEKRSELFSFERCNEACTAKVNLR